MGQENTIALVKDLGIQHQIGGLVTFVDDKGHLVARTWYPANAAISIPEVPEKPADNTYNYETVWKPVPDYCTGNQTIQLQYIAHRIDGDIPGDLNSDGIINSLDGLLLMRYLNGWDVAVADVTTMDVNHDGKVNSLDGLILMRYLNGWNVTLG